MSDTTANNKRIAKNTLLLYIRMFISMAVSLYTSRIILKTLGIEDYGIYNIVGGVVAMFSFINATMSTATSRFLTYELGRNDMQKLKETFNAAFWVHVIIALIVLVLCETIGLWFLNYKMVIPEGRELATHIVFQLSIISTVISITQVPYNATLISHEKMDIYAYVELANVFLKLGILFILVILPFDKLIVYGILTLFVSVSIMMFYRIYGIKHYEECRISMKWQSEIIKPMLTFSAWDFYGNMAVTARTQGVSMLLNVFFGPTLNAAAGVATTVQNSVMAFANNVTTAVKPQIVKSCAAHEYARMTSLINNSCKLNFLILSLLMVPLCAEIDYILGIWLHEVPPFAAIFCVLTLLFNLFANMSYNIIIGIEAYGKIIRPSLINGTLYLLVIPVSYLSYTLSGAPWTAYLFNVCAITLGLLSNVYTLHLYIPKYSVKVFLSQILLKCLILLALASVTAYLVTQVVPSSFYRLIHTTICTTVVMGVYGWKTMLSPNIKGIITDKLLSKIGKKK